MHSRTATATRRLALAGVATVLGLAFGPQHAALAQDARTCVVASGADTGAVQGMGPLPGGTLIGAANGLFLARDAGGQIAVSALAGDADTGRIFALQDLPGAGVLVGAANGLFVGRAAANDKLTLTRVGDIGGPVVQMLDVPGAGVLMEAARGWFLARVETGKVALVPVDTVAPVTPGTIGRLRSAKSLRGGALIEGNAWFMAREEGGKLTLALAGDATTGVVDAIGVLAGGGLLLHTEGNGFFLSTEEGGKLAAKPAGNVDTGHVFQMKRVGSAMLIWARNGWFSAREQGGTITLAPLTAETGQAFQLGELGDAVVISAERGLFVAREQNGMVTIAPAGDVAIGPALSGAIHSLAAGGTLIGASRGGWFFAREAAGQVTLTPADAVETGRVTLTREVAGRVLIGAEKGLFVAGAAPAGGCGAMVAQQRPAPAQGAPRPVCVAAVDADTGAVNALGNDRGLMLIGAEKGLFLAREQGGKVTVAPVSADGGSERVLAVAAVPGTALIGTEKGLFAARAQAGSALGLAPVAGVTGPVQVLRDLPGAGVLVGTENGLFLARVGKDGKVTVEPTRFAGQVIEMHDFPGGGVLIRAGGGLIVARAAAGKVTLSDFSGYAGSVRSLRSFAGGVMVEEEHAWKLLREVRGKITGTQFGDDVAGRVDAVGQFAAGSRATASLATASLALLHGDRGWFTARADGDKLTFAPVDGPDTDRVLRIARLGSGLLAQTGNGWFFARESGGKVGFARLADAQSGEVFATRELSPNALLIGAERGLLVAREQNGEVSFAQAGHSDTGPAFVLRNLPGGGVLIAAAGGWFVGRSETGGTITLTPAGSSPIGNVVMNMPDLGLQMRDFGAALLIGADAGLLVAAPAERECAAR